MNILRILIVEDEIVIARDLEEQLKSFGYSIVGIAKDSQTAISTFNELKPDLVLMDIILKKSSFDGIQIAEVLNNLRRVPIIYLTGSHSSKIQERAKSTFPANYLIKPCNEEQLSSAIEMAIYNFSQKKEASLTTEPFSKKQEVFPSTDCIFIKDKELFIKIDIDNLLWVKAANTYVEIYTLESHQVLTTSLKSFLQQFPHPKLSKVHRSYAVNLSKVHAFDGGSIYLQRKGVLQRIPVASPFREEVFKHFPKLKTKP